MESGMLEAKTAGAGAICALAKQAAYFKGCGEGETCSQGKQRSKCLMYGLRKQEVKECVGS